MKNKDNFTAHGSYAISNCCGYLVEISNCGDSARLNDNGEITDWLEIEYTEAEEGEDLEPVIDPDGYNVPLNLVMRINR